MATFSHDTTHLAETARQLGHAAGDGDIKAVCKFLVEYPGVLGVRGGIQGSTPLHFAAASGHLEIVQLLIEAGGDVDAREYASGTLPIHWASAHGHLEIVRLLVEKGARIDIADDWYGLPPIGWACALPPSSQAAVCEYLIAQGASYDIFSLISLQQSRHLRKRLAVSPDELSARIGRIGESYLPLQWAIERGSLPVVEALLDAGAEANAKSAWGISALGLATQQDKADLSDYLRSRGVAVDVSALLASGAYQEGAGILKHERSILERGGECERTVHWLIERNDIDGVKTLLDAGADPNVESEMLIDELLCSSTPLHRAAVKGSADIVRLLLERGADVDHRSRPSGAMPCWEITALHATAWRRRADIAGILMEYGADTAAVDNHGMGTPADWASSWWDDDMARYFR